MKLAQLIPFVAGLGIAGMPDMPYIPQPKEKKNDPERIALAEAKRNRKAAKRIKMNQIEL